MIRRTIFIKLRDSEVRRRRKIGSEIEHRWAKSTRDPALEVGLPADQHAADAWDLYIGLTTESLDDMQAALATRQWQDDIWPWLEELAVVTKAWNFVVD